MGVEPAPIPTAVPSQTKPPIEAAATTAGTAVTVVPATVTKPAAPADPSSWRALSRPGKAKASGARRVHREKPAAADSDEKDGDSALPGSKKPDPFAD